jgi:hypothetical protein
LLAYSASSSWMWAESRSRNPASSAVAGVHQIGPRNPSRTSRGSQPEWSMWAWVRRTASTSDGANPGDSQFRSRSSFAPWKSPQSTRIRVPATSRRKRDPVTVPAAPWKQREAMAHH